MLLKPTLFFLTTLFAVSANDECQTIATIKLGDKFTQFDRATIEKEISKEMQNLNANHFKIQYVKYTHSKLGAQYSAIANLYKCNK